MILDSALTGQPTALLIVGEAGIGKTRLAAAIASAAADRGFDVLCGRCDEAVATPFRPMIEALRPWLVGSGKGSPDDVGVTARNVARLGADLGDRADDFGSPAGHPEGQRLRMFEAVAELVQRRVADTSRATGGRRLAMGRAVDEVVARPPRPQHLRRVGGHRHPSLGRRRRATFDAAR